MLCYLYVVVESTTDPSPPTIFVKSGLNCERAVIIAACFVRQQLPKLHSIEFLCLDMRGSAAMLNEEGLPMFKELVDGNQI